MRILGGAVVVIVVLMALFFMYDSKPGKPGSITVVAGAPDAPGAGGHSSDASAEGDDWRAMMARADTVPLKTYEQVAEPFDQKIAVAQLMSRCGFRDLQWQQSTTAKLEELRDVATQPALEHMAEPELEQTTRFNATAIRGETSAIVTRDGEAQGCHEVMKSPPVQ